MKRDLFSNYKTQNVINRKESFISKAKTNYYYDTEDISEIVMILSNQPS
jgi:hypothetical protein